MNILCKSLAVSLNSRMSLNSLRSFFTDSPPIFPLLRGRGGCTLAKALAWPLFLPFPRDFSTVSPNREPVHRLLKHLHAITEKEVPYQNVKLSRMYMYQYYYLSLIWMSFTQRREPHQRPGKLLTWRYHSARVTCYRIRMVRCLLYKEPILSQKLCVRDASKIIVL